LYNIIKLNKIDIPKKDIPTKKVITRSLGEVVSSNLNDANANVVIIIALLNDECSMSKKLERGSSNIFLAMLYNMIFFCFGQSIFSKSKMDILKCPFSISQFTFA
jgi:hypothetical protein